MSTKFAPPPIAEALPAVFEVVPSRDEIPTILVPAGELVNVCRILRDHPSLRFNVCLDVTCVDVDSEKVELLQHDRVGERL
jgi:NADH:ubiquinone oxidoreductase subunit C